MWTDLAGLGLSLRVLAEAIVAGTGLLGDLAHPAEVAESRFVVFGSCGAAHEEEMVSRSGFESSVTVIQSRPSSHTMRNQARHSMPSA